MFRQWLLLLCMTPTLAAASPWFDGTPEFTDESSRTLAQSTLSAHGGMSALADAAGLEFHFFTKMIGNPTPFYSHESLSFTDGAARVDWPFWNARIAWDGNTLWTQRWPMPLPAGFFVRLSSSFLTLPWQMFADGVRIGPTRAESLPGDERVFDVLRIEHALQNPGLPGTFYDLYIDPQTKLMAGIGFNINHPGMVANPKQPLGPNFHVFGDYRDFSGAMIPTFYKSYGQGSAQGGKSNAYHFVWDFKLLEQYDGAPMPQDGTAILDESSMNWWGTAIEREGVNP